MKVKARKEDMVGQKYSRLLVVEEYGPNNEWWVMCDCGHKKVVSGHKLLNGTVRSCGCLQREATKRSGKILSKHVAYDRRPAQGSKDNGINFSVMLPSALTSKKC